MPDLRSELVDIERRARAASGERWELTRGEGGEPAILVRHIDGECTGLRVMRDLEPAAAEDVEFIAHSRDDVDVLLAGWRTGSEVAADTMAEISRRCEQASPGPWTASLESDGGIGGCNVITVSSEDDQQDMYLWCGDQLAPDADFTFVAGARQDIPRLLNGVRNQQRGERALTALVPFVAKWALPLNPEDLAEMAYAVLTNADSTATHDEIDLAVRHQLAEYTLSQARFQLEAYGRLEPIQAAVRAIVDLLIKRDFETIELAASPADRKPTDLKTAVAEYGRTLVAPEVKWWSTVQTTPINASAGGGLHVAAPLWTAEEGQSDLTLELRLRPDTAGRHIIEVLGLHVL